MLAFLTWLEQVLRPVPYLVAAAAVLVSPFAPAIARRLGKDPVKAARDFAILDAVMLLVRVTTAGLGYSIAPGAVTTSMWSRAAVEALVCLIAGAATVVVGFRAHRTSAST